MPSLEHSSEGKRNRPGAWERHLWVIFLLLRKLRAESHPGHVEMCPEDGHAGFGVQAWAGLHAEHTGAPQQWERDDQHIPGQGLIAVVQSTTATVSAHGLHNGLQRHVETFPPLAAPGLHMQREQTTCMSASTVMHLEQIDRSTVRGWASCIFNKCGLKFSLQVGLMGCSGPNVSGPHVVRNCLMLGLGTVVWTPAWGWSTFGEHLVWGLRFNFSERNTVCIYKPHSFYATMCSKDDQLGNLI